MAASDQTVMNIAFAAVAVAGPVLAVAIFWFGLRSARRHDARERAERADAAGTGAHFEAENGRQPAGLVTGEEAEEATHRAQHIGGPPDG